MNNSTGRERRETVHAAASERDCKRMAERNKWTLLRVEKTDVKDLPFDCVFEGECQFEGEDLP